jgi:hypothetical protein
MNVISAPYNNNISMTFILTTRELCSYNLQRIYCKCCNIVVIWTEMMFIQSLLADYVQTKQKLCFRFRPNELVLYENNPHLSMFKFRES